MKNQDQLYSLLEELVLIKKQQRVVEERLYQTLSRPVHRKWLHERVQDQYKHEKVICEITKIYLGKNLETEQLKQTQAMQSTIVQELYHRLENVTNNIQLINKITQPIEDFRMYKTINGLLCDEYIYQNRLIRILTER